MVQNVSCLLRNRYPMQPWWFVPRIYGLVSTPLPFDSFGSFYNCTNGHKTVSSKCTKSLPTIEKNCNKISFLQLRFFKITSNLKLPQWWYTYSMQFFPTTCAEKFLTWFIYFNPIVTDDIVLKYLTQSTDPRKYRVLLPKKGVNHLYDLRTVFSFLLSHKPVPHFLCILKHSIYPIQ